VVVVMLDAGQGILQLCLKQCVGCEQRAQHACHAEVVGFCQGAASL
jgi:hypothetical protein